MNEITENTIISNFLLGLEESLQDFNPEINIAIKSSSLNFEDESIHDFLILDMYSEHFFP